MESLERKWEFLYALVTMSSKYGGIHRHISATRRRALLKVRVDLCASIGVAEELIPVKKLDLFFAKHEEYARLPHKYPNAIIFKDTLPIQLINAYRETFAADEALPDCASRLMDPKEYRASWRARKVAEVAGYIAVPLACSRAALVAAYAMRKCRELYQHRVMLTSRVSPTQRRIATRTRPSTSGSG